MSLWPVLGDSSCSMCLLFDAVNKKRVEDLEDESVLWSVATRISLSTFATRLFLVSSRLSTAQHCIEKPNDLLDEGFIALATAERPPQLMGRQIHPDSIDFNVIRGWIGQCRTLHGESCGQDLTATAEAESLKLIDCEQRRIVQAPRHCKYVALSYVWGPNSGDSEDEALGQDLARILPRTIEDAITVTRELGLRFLWVDRYCIDQDNEAEKHHQIRQMDTIYRNAYVTTIAAAGDNPHAGLAGVSTTPRPPQPHAWIRHHHLVSTLTGPGIAMLESPWARRAWTFQESFFSRRRLIFTDQQVLFACRQDFARETLGLFEGRKDSVFPSIRDMHTPWGIWEYISAHCTRELSYGADAIRAIEGVFHFCETEFSMRHHQGIPMMPLTYTGKTGHCSRLMKNRTENFVAGLCWQHRISGRRRVEFPSWSWAGWSWTGSISSISSLVPQCMLGLGLSRHEERSLKVLLEDKNRLLLDIENDTTYSLIRESPGLFSRFIHLDAGTIPLNIQYLSNSPLEPNPNQIPSSAVRDSGYHAIFEDGLTWVLVPVDLLDETYNREHKEHDFASTFGAGKALGIVLSKRDGIHHQLMIVQDKGSNFERLGIAELGSWKTTTVTKQGDVSAGFWKGQEIVSKAKKNRRIRLG